MTAGNPVCAPYSGSSLGGCFAYCGGGGTGTACVEFRNDNPPNKGPYITNGNECQYKNAGDSNSGGNVGGNPDGKDGTHVGPAGTVDVGSIMVGDKYVSDFGKGFNVVANNVNMSAERIRKSITDLATQLDNDRRSDNANYNNFMISNLERIAQNTSGLLQGGGTGQYDHEIVGYLKSINDKTVLDPSFWMNEISEDRERAQYYYSNMRDLVAHIDGILEWGPNNGGGNDSAQLSNISNNSDSLLKAAMDQYDLTESILNELKKGGTGDGGTGDGGTGGPCEGPLCSFSEPTVGGGSGLSSVFGEQDIAGIKQQVTERKADIQEQMDQIKGVFSPGKLQVSGSYDNDYHDINGAKIDLSGKSNIELFFSLGPKQAIWFLAVLIAFGILLGGRKNA